MHSVSQTLPTSTPSSASSLREGCERDHLRGRQTLQGQGGHSMARSHLSREQSGQMGYTGKKMPRSTCRDACLWLGVCVDEVRGHPLAQSPGNPWAQVTVVLDRGRQARGMESAPRPAGRSGSCHLLQSFLWFWMRERLSTKGGGKYVKDRARCLSLSSFLPVLRSGDSSAPAIHLPSCLLPRLPCSTQFLRVLSSPQHPSAFQ